MIIKNFKFNNTDEATVVLGPQDIYLRELEKDFSVNISVIHSSADNSISLNIKGKKRNVDKTISRLSYVLKKYYSAEITDDEEENKTDDEVDNEDTAIYRSEFGTAVAPKTPNQELYIKAIEENDIVISVGPAGTGKTFLATVMALRMLKNKKIRKIVITRPIVEVGERLGFLPGDIDDKVNPYLRPVYDNFYNLLGPEKFQIYKEEDIIETLPLAYMRGRTLENSFIILDEAQNTTTSQMKMFLTRMGINSKIVITGDITQIDLESKENSGLITSLKILKDIKEIKIIKLSNSDIVRHPLVSKIVNAYERWEKNEH